MQDILSSALVIAAIIAMVVCAFVALRSLIKQEVRDQLKEREANERREAERRLMGQPMRPVDGLRDQIADLRRRSH